MMSQPCRPYVTAGRRGLDCSYMCPDCLPYYRDQAKNDVRSLDRERKYAKIAEEVDRLFIKGMENYYIKNIYSWIEKTIRANDLSNGAVAHKLNLGYDAVLKMRNKRKITVPNLVLFDIHFGNGSAPVPDRASLHVEGYIEAMTYLRNVLVRRHDRSGPLVDPIRHLAGLLRLRPVPPASAAARLTHEQFWVLFYSLNDHVLFTATMSANIDMELARARADEIIARKDRHISPDKQEIRTLGDLWSVIADHAVSWPVCLELIRPCRPVTAGC
jgi:hypothetical protein